MHSPRSAAMQLLPRGNWAPPTPEEQAAVDRATAMNEDLSDYLFYICAAVSFAVILWRVWDAITKYARKLACLGGDQRYFVRASSQLAALKKHVMYAPVLRQRHNREIQLSSAINVGTLPTRFQLLFLVAYFGTNVAFCVVGVRFSADWETATGELRNRSGVLSVVNMVPLFLLAGRNNPLIPLLGISFDHYNLLHRWFGRIVILEALAHTLAHVAKNGWGADAWNGIFASDFLLWGFIATCAFVAIGIQAWSPLRHAFYETFKVLHIAFAIVSIIGLWYHCKLGEIEVQMKYLYGAVALWVADRVARVLRVFFYNIGRGSSRTTVEALPDQAVRITTTLCRPWNPHPGQHAYLYMPAFGLWQSHPFSVAWWEGVDDVASEKLPTSTQELRDRQRMSVSFVARAQTGFTAKLYRKAEVAPDRKLDVTCWAEGPYGVRHPLDSYGTVLLFAGGVGITHAVPFIRDLIGGYAAGTVATRKVVLVWIIRHYEDLEWVRPYFNEILGMEGRRDVLRIRIFISQPRSKTELVSPSTSVSIAPGRPNVDTIVATEQHEQLGAMAVSVCGPGALSDQVRKVVRAKQSLTTIDLYEEAFSW